MQKVVGVVEVEEEEVVGVVDGFPLDPPHQGHIHHQDHTDHQDPQVHLLGLQDQDLPVHLGAKVTNHKIITITSLTTVFHIGKEDHIIQPIIGEISYTYKLTNILVSFLKVQYIFISIFFNIWNSF